MHEFSVRKDINFFDNDKRRKEVVVGKFAGAFMSNTNYIKKINN
jgi:hypothetical protein